MISDVLQLACEDRGVITAVRSGMCANTGCTTYLIVVFKGGGEDDDVRNSVRSNS